MEGAYETQDGKPTVRFDRSLDYPVEVVWEAVTDPAKLARWFPTTVEVDLQVGGAMKFAFPDGGMDDMTGEVTELDPPRLFAFRWGEDLLRLELEPEGPGCRLRLTHHLTDADEAARTAAGWHVCLDRLAELVATGQAKAPSTEPTDEWREHYDRYVAAGVPSGAEVPGG
jgi:uncharacterized protein YndB with AHSA1/START domain